MAIRARAKTTTGKRRIIGKIAWLDEGLVGAGIGRDGSVEEVFLEGGDAGSGQRLAAGGGGDDGYELEFGEGGARNVEALGVRASIGWGEVEACVPDEVVEEGEIGGGEAFEEVARAEGHAEPEAFGAGTSEEGAAGEALRVGGVGQIEVADVADVLDVVEGQ